MTKHDQLIAAISVALFATACGAALPSPELVEAREAYDRAKGGAAAELAPVQLEDARQSLASAEAAFEDDAEAAGTQDLAYVALRHVQFADAMGAQATARLRAHQTGICDLLQIGPEH